MAKPHPDILSALTAGIQAEVAAYVFYLEASKKVEDKKLAKPLTNLAGEERKHFQILDRQYDSLIRSEKWISTADILKQEGLPEIGEDMRNEHKDLVNDVGRMNTDREILAMALKLEEDARDTYVDASKRADTTEAKDTFAQLIKFEQGHVNYINSLLESLDD